MESAIYELVAINIYSSVIIVIGMEIAFVFESAIAARVKQMWTDVSPTYEMPLIAS